MGFFSGQCNHNGYCYVADLGPMSCLKATRFLKGPSKIYGWVRITLNTRSRARLGHNRSGLLVVFK